MSKNINTDKTADASQNRALRSLRYHVTGAIERGEAKPIIEVSAAADKIAQLGRSYVDIGHVGDGSGESLLPGDFVCGARHYRDITNDTRETLDRLISAEQQRDELLEACKGLLGAYAPRRNEADREHLHSSVLAAIDAIAKVERSDAQGSEGRAQ